MTVLIENEKFEFNGKMGAGEDVLIFLYVKCAQTNNDQVPANKSLHCPPISGALFVAHQSKVTKLGRLLTSPIV